MKLFQNRILSGDLSYCKQTHVATTVSKDGMYCLFCITSVPFSMLSGLGGNWLARGGGGGSSPFPGPPPFWAPVTRTPDGLTVTRNRLTGEVGGGPEVPQHI